MGGRYEVAFHEFLKSVMLSGRRYYKESDSPLLNLYDCGAGGSASHFTAIRILRLLLVHHGQSSTEGRGYVEVGKAISAFESMFDNREDVVRTMNRLVEKQLVETNDRSTENIVGASHVRVTSAGWFYSDFLEGSFPYLDLVLQDTPIASEEVAEELLQAVGEVDNWGDKPEEKEQRLAVRFRRVETFLKYLTEEETRERATYRLEGRTGPVCEAIMPSIVKDFVEQKERILRRLQENRDREVEDVPFDEKKAADYGVEVSDEEENSDSEGSS